MNRRFFIQRAIWLLAALTAVLTFTSSGLALAAPADLRVMSFNIRYSRGTPHEEKAENDWNDKQHPRRERAVRVIRDYRPDVFGVQEARAIQVDDLRKALPDYAFYGPGRDDGKKGGECTGIFYLKNRFELVGKGSFWLSETPEKIGTTFSKLPNALPRMASWLQLRDKNSDKEFVVLNTHWDHLSGDARRQSARLIRAQIAKIAGDLPYIIMGDFNASADSPATTALLGKQGDDFQLIDSYRQANPTRTREEGTFNSWAGKTDGDRIDFIIHNDRIKTKAAEIVRTHYDGLWPSDHYPITATLQLQN